MNELEKVTARFQRAYQRQKKSETWLKQSQKKLFSAFDKARKEQTLAQETILIPEGEDRDRYVQTYFPRWAVVKYTDDGAIIQENPSLQAFTYVDQALGIVVGRTTVTATPSLDDERLKVEDPFLWDRVSEWPAHLFGLARQAAVMWTRSSPMKWHDSVLDGYAESVLEEYGVERVLKDPAKMDFMDLSELQAYIIPGKVSVRLVPPRQAREDELE